MAPRVRRAAPALERHALEISTAPMPCFRDRAHAGRRLAEMLVHLCGREDIAVLAVPRGGVPVAYEVALDLRAPLDVVVVRKVGAPGQPELAMGAVASGGVQVWNRDVLAEVYADPVTVDRIVREAEEEVLRRERRYRGGMPRIDPRGMTAVVVDDGVATGASLEAALRAVRAMKPAALIAAVPVASPAAVLRLGAVADDFVCPVVSERIWAVGQAYVSFPQVPDESVERLLGSARREHAHEEES